MRGAYGRQALPLGKPLAAIGWHDHPSPVQQLRMGKRLQALSDFCPTGKTSRNLPNRINANAHASIVENTTGLF